MATWSVAVAKTLFIPALISLVFYAVLFYAITPFIRRHRQRYAQYLPLDALSQRTTGLRDRALEAMVQCLLPSSWRRPPIDGQDDESDLDDEEGEGMIGFHMDPSRRAALERQRGTGESDGRLSRELEEGFRDDSDDEHIDARHRQTRA